MCAEVMTTCVCIFIHEHTYVCRGQDNFQYFILSFHPVGLGDQTQIARLGGKLLSLLSHLTSPD